MHKTIDQLKKDIGVTHRALAFLRERNIGGVIEPRQLPEEETTEALEVELGASVAALRIAEQSGIFCPNWGRHGYHWSACNKASCDGCWARHLVDWAKSLVDPETEEHFKKRSDYAEGEDI